LAAVSATTSAFRPVLPTRIHGVDLTPSSLASDSNSLDLSATEDALERQHGDHVLGHRLILHSALSGLESSRAGTYELLTAVGVVGTGRTALCGVF
jgi:hypothetical protein